MRIETAPGVLVPLHDAPDAALLAARDEIDRRRFAAERRRRRERDAEHDRIMSDPVLRSQYEEQQERDRKLRAHEFFLEHGNAP